jgi:formamidopyrimidine-DNA glycosylase
VQIPDRSRAQRLAALERANTIRSGRKRLKIELKARGAIALIALIVRPEYANELVDGAPDGLADTMHVRTALVATRGIGRVKADSVLRRAGVAPSKTIGGLTRQQRARLAAALAPMRRLNAAPPATQENRAA